MRLVLDSGALVALERNDRKMWRRFKAALLASQVPVTHGGVIGQVWRARGSRQTLLAKALEGIDVRPLDDQLGREAGAVLALARMNDVIDAAVVLLARDGDQIVSSDVEDLRALAQAAGLDVELVRA